ncbi:hypothetical protein Pla22_28910 [Rubripirellula amarantea]|uniref:Uncharacterized protein n=1 Tax=Rubripirellula amarantea TaxID=2527999 RepID=A0A5C5WJF1_9BACT|nr:hypothetical protein Pla22_28910 [Rubripirellula amarantea]
MPFHDFKVIRVRRDDFVGVRVGGVRIGGSELTNDGAGFGAIDEALGVNPLLDNASQFAVIGGPCEDQRAVGTFG